MPIFWSKHLLNSDIKCFEARRRYVDFMRQKIEVTGDDYSATMTGGWLNVRGTISEETGFYELDRDSMKLRNIGPPAGSSAAKETARLDNCDATEIASYSITDRFLILTIAEMNELRSSRDFQLRQEFGWMSSLVLLENGEIVGQFAASPLASSSYKIRVQKHVPREIVLLSVWIAMVRTAFG